MSKPKILYFDLETSPLQAWVWGCGKQYVGPHQLVEGYTEHDVICMSYCWNDGRPAQVIDWGLHKQDSKPIIEKFDYLIQYADICIGKNNFRFDNHFINLLRHRHGLPGNSAWTKYSDDLERLLRRQFGKAFPSHKLDYLAETYLGAGKIKMGLEDWTEIIQNKSKPHFTKMLEYAKKDIEDTRKLYNLFLPHIEPKLNYSAATNTVVCKTCGSKDIKL